MIDPGSPPGDQIVNIGLGGLTFNRIDNGKPLPERFRIDLFLEGKVYLEKVKAKLVTNVEVGDISYSSKNVRRISVQFLSLTPVQKFDLKALIKSYGMEEDIIFPNRNGGRPGPGTGWRVSRDAAGFGRRR